MAVAKVTLNNNVIVDMTDATAAANKILSTYTAYVADGTKATGSLTALQAETGTITLASDFSLSTSPQNIPGLQLSFQPDFFLITPDRDAFEDLGSYSGGLWGLVAEKRSIFPPYATNATTTPESETSDYTFFVQTSVVANTSLTGGYGLGGLGSILGNSYYSRYAVNANGTVSVGRYSSASTKMFACTYRYLAIKI